jgi:hypothetical protein
VVEICSSVLLHKYMQLCVMASCCISTIPPCIRNNLQVLAELIKLQARQKETEDKLKELASENKVLVLSILSILSLQ